MTFEEEIRDKFLKSFRKEKLIFYIGAFCLWGLFQGKEFLDALSSLPKIEAFESLFKAIFLAVMFWFISKTLFYMSYLPRLREALEKTEKILNVAAFYPPNYTDLPKTSKYKIRDYISDSITQIKEQGVPLIICDEDKHYALYEHFAEGTIKIYGTATKPPFYYASYEKIKDYIKFFRSKDVKRVTILGLDEIQQIIARNIYHIDDSGKARRRIPEIIWYETVFNENGKHWWFLEEVPNKFILTDIHHVRTYTNYAVYLVNNNHRLLLNYYERRDKKGFFLLRCISPDDKADEVAINISDFIGALEGGEYSDFYDKFENMVKNESRIKNTFNSFKEKNFDISGDSIKVSDLLSSKNLTPVNSWEELFIKLEDKKYRLEFINRFPQIKLKFGLRTLKI